MDKLLLFNQGTSKTDLKANKNLLMNLEQYALSSQINYNMDSNHTLTVALDVDLLADKVNSIPQKGIIKTYAQNKTDYWIIVNIDKSLDELTLSCRHWTTEIMLSMFIVDSKPRLLNAKDMLNHFKVNSQEYLQNKQYAKELETYSNLPTDVYKNMNSWHSNLYETVSDMKELYGAEIKKQEFEVALMDFVGSKTPVYKIEYGKNLLRNSSEEDLNITTGVLAKGYDKLYADNIIYSGKFKDNPRLLGQTVEMEYPIRLIEEDKEKEEGYIYFNTESEAKKELERLASLEFSINRIDEPKITFDTTFLDLTLVEECKEQEKVFLSIGDTVSTSIPKFNININTRIIEMTLDVLADEVTSITLSNNDISELKPPTLNSIKQEIIKTENKFQIKLEDEINGVESNIEQTSEKILLEVKNTKEGLESSISQTASSIRSEVSNADQGLQSQINQNANAITSKVSNSEFNTYKSQTANTISQKVSKGNDFATEFNQNAEGFNFNIGNSSMNVNINKNGVNIKNGALIVTNSNGTVTIDGSKRLFRLLTWGNGNIVLYGNETSKTITIPHNLGYSPMFRGQFRFANSSNVIETYENNFALLNWETGTVNRSGRMWVDDRNLYISIWRSASEATAGQKTFYYRYFIEEGVGL